MQRYIFKSNGFSTKIIDAERYDGQEGNGTLFR